MDDSTTMSEPRCGSPLLATDEAGNQTRHECARTRHRDGTDHECSHGTTWPDVAGLRVELGEGEQ